VRFGSREVSVSQRPEIPSKGLASAWAMNSFRTLTSFQSWRPRWRKTIRPLLPSRAKVTAGRSGRAPALRVRAPRAQKRGLRAAVPLKDVRERAASVPNPFALCPKTDAPEALRPQFSNLIDGA